MQRKLTHSESNNFCWQCIYGWIFCFGGRVTINCPEDVKDEYAEMVVAAALEK